MVAGLNSPKSDFDVTRLLANGAMFDTTFMSAGFKRLFNTAEYLAEAADDEKTSEMSTRLAMVVNTKWRLAHEALGQISRGVATVKKLIAPRDNQNDRPSFHAPLPHPRQHEKIEPEKRPTAHFQQAASGVAAVIGSAATHKIGDAVEAVAGAEIRHIGGHLSRGEFRAAAARTVEDIAGKETRHFIGQTVRDASNLTSTAFNAAATAATSIKDGAVNIVSTGFSKVGTLATSLKPF